MSAETIATWRYAIGQRVRWAGDPAQSSPITARRWVERQILAPYAEYQLEGHWEVEADLEAVDGRAGARET